MSSPSRQEIRRAMIDWIHDELHDYTDELVKADPGDPHHVTWTPEVQEWWEGIVLGYIGRARVLGDTPLGHQAILKAMTSMFEMAVTMTFARGGDVPAPGHPSGELETWEW